VPDLQPPRWIDRRAAPAGLLAWTAGLLVAAMVCVIWIDGPFARYVAAHDTWPGMFERGIAGLEVAFGLPISRLAIAVVLVAGMLVTASVRAWRGSTPAWAFVAATVLVTRIATNGIKDAAGRLRPHEWLATAHGDPLATFWRDGVSFPSGHVAVFASVIVPLAIVSPRIGRALLLVIAFTMLARVAVLAHFPSDVLGALALVTLITWICGVVIRPLRQ
jgi:membrane-associated phospholipid phosphatase